ncbi:MAG TPA: hypothetical protein VGH95_00645 [Candidatus Aquirickettsiella sp.]|jgi:hypothetical protein
MKKLFVIDFDGTIVSGHTHNTIIKAQNTDDPEYVNGSWAVVHGFPIIGSPNAWKNNFETLNQQGHYMAIASFNGYGSIISEFLKKMDLAEEVIEKINIITGLPADPKTANKNEYIQQAIEDAIKESGEKKDFSGDPEDVFLIDDSKKNIKAASEKGYQVIHAKKDGSHLTELQEKLEELDKLEEKPPVVDRSNKPKYLKQDQETSRSEEIKQQIEALESQRIEDIKTINQLKNNKSLSPEEKLTLASLKSEVDGIELSIKAKYDYLSEEKEKLAPSIVDRNKPKHVESIQTEKQDPVPTSGKPADNTHKQVDLKELLDAKPKKDKLLENSSKEEDASASFKDKQKLIGDLLAKPRTSPNLGNPSLSQATLFALPGNSSTSRDNTKTPEIPARKQFSQ